jgi:hypothetical protein
VHITGNVKETFSISGFPLQVDQVEKYVQNASAGEG